MLKRQVSKVVVSSLAALAIQSLCIPCSTAARGSAAPKSVTVLGHVLVLKDMQGGGAGQAALAEYIPAGETLENWTLMFALRFAPGDLDPKASAAATVQNIQTRKRNGQDPLANCGVFASKDGKSVNVDFLVSTTSPQLLEHNIMRYVKVKDGLETIQIARRIYGNQSSQAKVTAFIKNIPTLRTKLFQEIGRPDLPRWPN
jgi:hypothetical protein